MEARQKEEWDVEKVADEIAEHNHEECTCFSISGQNIACERCENIMKQARAIVSKFAPKKVGIEYLRKSLENVGAEGSVLRTIVTNPECLEAIAQALHYGGEKG